MNFNVIFDFLILVAVIIMVLYFIGSATTHFLLLKFNDFKKMNFFILSPIVATSIIVLSMELMLFIGFNARVSTLLILIGVSIINVYYFLLNKKIYNNFSIKIRYVFVFIMLLFTLSFPLFTYNSLLVIGTNGDAVSYSVVADYLINHNTSNLKLELANSPYNQLVSNLILSNNRLGSMYLLSFVSVLTAKGIHELFTIISNLYLVFSILATLLFARTIYRVGKIGNITLMLLLSLNTLLLWGSYGNFLAQVHLYPFMILGIMYFLIALEQKNKLYMILAAIMAATILSIYPESFVYIITFLGIYSVFNINKFKQYLFTLIAVGLGSALLNIVGFIRFINYIIPKMKSDEFAGAQRRAVSGDIHHFLDLRELFGIIPHFHSAPIDFPAVFDFVSYAIMLVILLAILLVIFRLNPRLRNISISLIITFASIALVNKLINFPYGYYKTISLFVPFIIILFVVSLKDLVKQKRFVFPFLIIVFGLNLLSFVLVANKVNSPMNEGLLEVQSLLEEVDKNQIVYTETYNQSVKQMWLFYFMKNVKVASPTVSQYFGDPSMYNNITNPDYLLLNKAEKMQVDEDIWDIKKIKSKGDFLLIPRRSEVTDIIRPKKDFALIDKGETIKVERSQNKLLLELDGDQIVYDLKSKEDKVEIRLKFLFKKHELELEKIENAHFDSLNDSLILAQSDSVVILKNNIEDPALFKYLEVISNE
ncbi:hypothetical protein [Paenibacillus turpanensis]|uniref:hypothetical protein n=1 Tax=Paenibacillus turpanensis TaxID=2689078 RepID=UPI00140BD411|nr:hypothetical protein [Paenibacillus turpanensis]